MTYGPSWAPEVAETHSAWVVMLGERAYKIKKPVTLDFLDFSTVERRERAIRRELELNRRFAPDVYLGVADVTGPDGGRCEHLLVMRRLDPARRLATLVRAGAPLDDEIRAVTRIVATAHASASRSPEISASGAPEAVRARIERDLAELHDLAGGILDPATPEEVGQLAGRYLQGRRRLLEDRVARGHIVDGHGDLLAGDIFCLEDGPRVLDCLDFDDRLRYGDVLADVAFLAMDLERLGAPGLARLLLAEYQELSDERHPATLADYYVAARAIIRSKVACVRAGQGDGASVLEARALLDLAVHHLRRAQVHLVLVGGAPGTGKSTLASGLADRLGFVVLRSDEMRKDLLGIAHSASAADEFGQGAYDRETTAATYRGVLDRARAALELGASVIVDASWSSSVHRAEAARLANDSFADLVELCCDAPADLAAQRIEARRAGARDASDATTEIAAAMRASFDAWPTAHVVETTGTPPESVDAALRACGLVVAGE
jgi:aminoglycoside phosphotransferase family enzyme/predicted kinase